MLCGTVVEAIRQDLVFAQEPVVGVLVTVDIGLRKFCLVNGSDVRRFRGRGADQVAMIVTATGSTEGATSTKEDV